MGTSCGRLCLYRKKINLSITLAGQAVGVKEVDEGNWLVSFMHYDLGYIDLEEKTLQPLENPFGLHDRRFPFSLPRAMLESNSPRDSRRDSSRTMSRGAFRAPVFPKHHRTNSSPMPSKTQT